MGFTGHVKDDSGLTYMQARYYDPVIGRFYSNDPDGTMDHLSIGNIQGFNRYAYGNNNPYRYIDPTGMAPEDIDEPKSQGNTEKAIEMISDFFSSTQETADTVQTEISEVAEEITPSREKAHAVGSVTAVGLTVASVTTPCTALCGGAATAISAAQATDHAIQGKPVDAALALLPAGAGKITSATFKATQQVSKAEAGAIVDATLSAVQIIDK
ncbi:RHS repeat-associated core domain-containing protein [Shewanella basaltis]|nr:RHS repeat-associated core domain-containing protein [Shewanella basaltis]